MAKYRVLKEYVDPTSRLLHNVGDTVEFLEYHKSESDHQLQYYRSLRNNGFIEEIEDEPWQPKDGEGSVEWLKAFKVLRDDTKGFRPDWSNDNCYRCSVSYDHDARELRIHVSRLSQEATIYFATEEDAKASIEKHKKEWLIFFGVEDD